MQCFELPVAKLKQLKERAQVSDVCLISLEFRASPVILILHMYSVKYTYFNIFTDGCIVSYSLLQRPEFYLKCKSKTINAYSYKKMTITVDHDLQFFVLQG